VNFDSNKTFAERQIIRKCKKFPITIFQGRTEGQEDELFKSSCIMTFKSVKSFGDFFIRDENPLRTSPKLHLKFYLSFQHGSFVDLENVFEERRKLQLEKSAEADHFDDSETNLYFYFLFGDNRGLTLSTFVLFSQTSCNVLQQHEVNLYDKSLKKWQSGDFEVQKHRNFHGCEINVEIAGDSDDIERSETRVIGDDIRVGLIKNTFEVISKSANCTYKYIKYQSEAIDIFVILTCNKDLTTLGYKTTFPFLTIPYFIASPLGQEYDCYEKLLLPFDYYTWILILMTFASAIATIWLLKFTSASVRNFVIGEEIQQPTEDVARILLGISQTRLPRRNFARFLTMVFILFCLIIRTAWQGKIFEFMQKDMRKPRPESYQEMIDQNFTLYSLTEVYKNELDDDGITISIIKRHG
jgi:hypothetical protein